MKNKLSNSLHAPTASQETASESGWLDFALGLNDVTCDYRSLGFDEDQIEVLNMLVAIPDGITMFIGQTGSGKTLTFAQASVGYKILHNNKRKVISVEDPVELRSDENDPDMILLREIRDRKTAMFAFDCALTGHKVFSSFHAKAWINVFQRLILVFQMPPSILGGMHINGIISQRRLATLCPHCSVPFDSELALSHGQLGVNKTLAKQIVRASMQIDRIRLAGEKGCEKCNGRGTQGVTIIAEFMVMDATIGRHIAASEFNEAFLYWRSGKSSRQRYPAIGRSFMEQAITKMNAGLVSPVEVVEALGALDTEAQLV